MTIFWVCLTAYILLGAVSSKIVYNKIFDETYQNILNVYLRSGIAKEDAEDNAYNFVLNSTLPGNWAIGVFIIWPLYWFVTGFNALFEWVASLMDKIMPPRAHKAKVARDEARVHKAELEEYEKALKIVQGK